MYQSTVRFIQPMVTSVAYIGLQPHSLLTGDTLNKGSSYGNNHSTGLLWTYFGFMRGSVKVKLLIIGGVDGSVALCR